MFISCFALFIFIFHSYPLLDLKKTAILPKTKKTVLIQQFTNIMLMKNVVINLLNTIKLG